MPDDWRGPSLALARLGEWLSMLCLPRPWARPSWNELSTEFDEIRFGYGPRRNK